MSLGVVLFECTGLDQFVVDKEKSSLEFFELVPIKARELVLRIRKKISPMVSLRWQNRLHYDRCYW